VGLFAAWLLYCRPHLRILVLAADFELAKKMVRNVKRVIELHPLCEGMKPAKADQWASDRFTVKRNLELRDPSMLARGIDSNITGSRADIVICDDVEVPNTSDTANKRADLREKLLEISYVLVPGGTELYVGTPHTYFTIYADKPREQHGEERAFLDGYHILKIPVFDAGGNSAWPERFSIVNLERIRTQTGPNKFASQMMLEPVNIAEGRLNPDLLQWYDEELDYTKELGALFVAGRKMVSASSFWDPAFAAAKGDNSVLACVFADEEGNYFLHRVAYIRADGGEIDEATAQCRMVASIAKALYLPSITVETNGIGKFLPSILRNELALAHVPTSVQEFSQTRPKDIRIVEAFDAVMAAGRLYAHTSVQQTPFMTEMREWNPARTKGHDDGLDAIAGAILQQPIRLKKHYGKGGQIWTKSSRAPYRARTDFDV
ncbi:MAG: phage terminase large subunit, partial [Alphaproteobacteria bacterium]|nr:phage terminase large subunit [Alphaproteobacteria bacterium]